MRARSPVARQRNAIARTGMRVPRMMGAPPRMRVSRTMRGAGCARIADMRSLYADEFARVMDRVRPWRGAVRDGARAQLRGRRHLRHPGPPHPRLTREGVERLRPRGQSHELVTHGIAPARPIDERMAQRTRILRRR